MAVVCLFFTGCIFEKEDEESGSLKLSFQLGSGIGDEKNCEDIGIERVRAVLDDDRYEKSVDCEEGEIRLSDIEPGTYILKLYGYDKKDKAIKDSEPQQIRIKDGETLEIDRPIALLNSPALLKLRWDFDFSDCDKAGIGGFIVTAYNSDGTDQLLDEEVTCDYKDSDDENYLTVPDKERSLKGDDFGEVFIQPVDENDDALGDPITFSFSSPGAGGVVKLTLLCSDTGCEGSGKAD